MADERIRVTVLCVCLHEGKILVKEMKHSGVTYYRPLGGGVEFNEHSTDAIKREMKEEISADITGLRFLGTLENRWADDVGKRYHVVYLVYDGKFIDARFYSMEHIPVDENGAQQYAVWKPLSAFPAQGAVLYPDGLLELLRE